MKDILKMGFVLLIVCAAAGLALGSVYKVAWPKILEQRRLARERALKEVMPDAESSREVNSETLGTYYEGIIEGGAVVCYAKEVSVKGYGGPIGLMVGINNADQVCGVKVLSHLETPGLGAKINELKYGEKTPWFTQQFMNKGIDSLEVVKMSTEDKIEAITGATISSAAVNLGVKQVMEEINSLGEAK